MPVELVKKDGKIDQDVLKKIRAEFSKTAVTNNIRAKAVLLGLTLIEKRQDEATDTLNARKSIELNTLFNKFLSRLDTSNQEDARESVGSAELEEQKKEIMDAVDELATIIKSYGDAKGKLDAVANFKSVAEELGALARRGKFEESAAVQKLKAEVKNAKPADLTPGKGSLLGLAFKSIGADVADSASAGYAAVKQTGKQSMDSVQTAMNAAKGKFKMPTTMFQKQEKQENKGPVTISAPRETDGKPFQPPSKTPTQPVTPEIAKKGPPPVPSRVQESNNNRNAVRFEKSPVESGMHTNPGQAGLKKTGDKLGPTKPTSEPSELEKKFAEIRKNDEGRGPRGGSH